MLKTKQFKFHFQNDCPAAKTYWPVVLRYCDTFMTHNIKPDSNRQQEGFFGVSVNKYLLSQYISSFKLWYKQQVKIIPTIWNRQRRPKVKTSEMTTNTNRSENICWNDIRVAHLNECNPKSHWAHNNQMLKNKLL